MSSKAGRCASCVLHCLASPWCRLLILDAKLYLAAAWYLDNVLPGTFGPRQHWTFVFRPSYWCATICQIFVIAGAHPI